MHTQETINQFIELRAQGNSFAFIAEKLSVQKSTLILWSRKFQNQIQNLRAVESEAMAEQLMPIRKERSQKLINDLNRLELELEHRDLSDIPTTQLIKVIVKLRQQAADEAAPLRFVEATDNIPPDELETHKTTHHWTA